MVHKRLAMEENGKGIYNGRRVRKDLFECFWDDTKLRVRNAGVSVGVAECSWSRFSKVSSAVSRNDSE